MTRVLWKNADGDGNWHQFHLQQITYESLVTEIRMEMEMPEFVEQTHFFYFEGLNYFYI